MKTITTKSQALNVVFILVLIAVLVSIGKSGFQFGVWLKDVL